MQEQPLPNPDTVTLQAKSVLISPPDWRGDEGCVIGPFVRREVAKLFAERVVFVEADSRLLFEYKGKWFVAVSRLIE